MRLRREARSVKIGGLAITEVTAMTVEDARTFFRELQLSPFELSVGERLLEEIRTRLTFLHNVGLEYLSLDRLASTLSGGEAQRIQLATSLGSSLVGTLYVLDEPSIGLHARDNQRLIEILKSLRDMGNTVLVVEHESAMMKAADRIIDLGPGAGEQGGQMIFSGTFAELLRSGNSLTGKYLKEELKIHVPTARLVPNGQWLKIYGAREHNLKNVEVSIPMGMMTCITGVSGSGKSTWCTTFSMQHSRPSGENHPSVPTTIAWKEANGFRKRLWSISRPSDGRRDQTQSRTPRRSMQFAISLPPRARRPAILTVPGTSPSTSPAAAAKLAREMAP